MSKRFSQVCIALQFTGVTFVSLTMPVEPASSQTIADREKVFADARVRDALKDGNLLSLHPLRPTKTTVRKQALCGTTQFMIEMSDVNEGQFRRSLYMRAGLTKITIKFIERIRDVINTKAQVAGIDIVECGRSNPASARVVLQIMSEKSEELKYLSFWMDTTGIVTDIAYR